MRRLALVGLIFAIGCSSGPTSPPPTTGMPTTTVSTMLIWPVIGVEGKDWVINSYVDVDPTSGITDYTGATGGNAKTSDGHLGIDIDSPNFRWMDAGVPVVGPLPAASVGEPGTLRTKDVPPALAIDVETCVSHLDL